MKTRVLLSSNKEREQAQRVFNEIALEKLDKIRTIFLSLKIGELSLADIDLIYEGNTRSIIRGKLASKIKDTQVAGFPLKAERALDLIDLETSEFEFVVSEFSNWCKSEINAGGHSGIPVELNKKFFKVVNSQFSIDEDQVLKWVEEKCKRYTNNPTQLKVHELTSKLCDTLNELLTLKADPSTSRENFSSKDTTEKIKQNPSVLFEEEGLSQLVSLRQGKFVVSENFILNH
ncbi:MAG: hypothetical protein KF856_14285 [Cyclobacteriaceae bacterium]|nr:hypothetical protein [Cyclobacteriaceae bacterium]